MKLNDIIIISERLKQIPICENFIGDIFENFTSEVTKYMYPQPSDNINNIVDFVRSSMEGVENGTNLQMVVLDKETNEFLGCSGLHHIDRDNPELGIWIKKLAHNKSYGYEAVAAIIEWAKENIKYEYLKYPVDRRNYASKRIPENYGGKIAKKYKLNNTVGKELDIVEYWIY
ncbi:MAG: GNAT family N-acetyltransferase [Alkaliphilus sp.]